MPTRRGYPTYTNDLSGLQVGPMVLRRPHFKPGARPRTDCYWNEVLADNPTMLLPMQEAAGTLNDLLIGNNAIVSGAAMTYRVTGPDAFGIPFGVRFADTTKATIADSTDVKLGDGPLSIEFWMKRTAAGVAYTPVIKSDNATNPGYQITWNTNQIRWQDGDGTNVVTSAVVTDLGWHHYVITRGLVVDDGLIWCDGEQIGTPVGTVTFTDSTLALVLGNNFVGDMAAFAVYKSVLSMDRVRAHYDALKVDCASFPSYWDATLTGAYVDHYDFTDDLEET